MTKRKSPKILKNPSLRAREVAQRAKPNMRVVDVVPEADELRAKPDAVVKVFPQMSKNRLANGPASSAQELHMVAMQVKNAADSRTNMRGLGGPRVHIVDEDQVIAEQG